MGTSTTTPADRAIAYATQRGAEDGRAAASWVIDGNMTEATARTILAGIADGDPAVLDTLPHADLSGQWADTLTGPELVDEAIVNADDWTMTRGAWLAYWSAHDVFTEICDAYELAYATAVEDAVSASARAIIAED